MHRPTFVIAAVLAVALPSAALAKPPNVVVIITDDQGHGDFGVHGNPVIQTPNLDRLASQSTRLTRFHVSPVCSPTRASLMTGRYNYRTGVVDTYIGRSMMDPAEVTVAEMLGAAGYRTGIFGKWHLGDCYPMGPGDQGFQESLVLKGGGIGQPSDPLGGEHYFDTILQHNGVPEKRNGYCSDVFTDAAIAHVDASVAEKKPFFVYLPFNCPHDPLEVSDAYRKRYDPLDLGPAAFPKEGYPFRNPVPHDVTARVYGMITNIDENVGRLLKHLDEKKLADDTIVVFLTDNGPAHNRFNSGLRGRKTQVYDGGIRTAGFWRFPGKIPAGATVDRITAHIDITPTLLEACEVAKPENVRFDGVSLWPLLTGKTKPADWPGRTLFFQWHRGDAPERFRAFAARDDQFKLVRAEGPTAPNPPRFELFDMLADPFELKDLAAEKPEVVERLKAAYSAWFDDVGKTRGYAPPRIHLGSKIAPITMLTRQDWRVPVEGWANGVGHWEVLVERPFVARLALRFKPPARGGTLHAQVGSVHLTENLRDGTDAFELHGVRLPEGPASIEVWVEKDGKKTGVWSVEVSLAPE